MFSALAASSSASASRALALASGSAAAPAPAPKSASASSGSKRTAPGGSGGVDSAKHAPRPAPVPDFRDDHALHRALSPDP